MRFQILFTLWLIGILPQGCFAEDVKAGVVMSFRETLFQLKPLFEKETGHHLIIVADSAEALFQKMMVNEDDIDVFLSGDARRPKELVRLGIGLSDSFTVYALGRLVLWTKAMNHAKLNENFLRKLNSLALSDPQNTPYGYAARELLQGLNLWDNLQSKIQMLRTTADVYKAVSNNQAEAGFISLSQYFSSADNLGTNYWVVPQYSHSPLYHGAVISAKTQHLEGGRALLRFLRHPKALQVIREFGFRVPDLDETDD